LSTSAPVWNTRGEIERGEAMTDTLIPFRRPSGLQQSPDEALITAAAAGDNAALEELFQRHGDSVHRILSRLRTIDRRDLDDVVQKTFIEVQRSAGSYDGRAAVGTWVIGVAMNVARRHTRGEVRRRAVVSAIAELPAPTAAATPYDQAAHRQLLSRLASAFDELPHDLRAVFTLCDLEGMRGAEVARVLRVPEGTVWRRLHNARERLRARIDGGAPR
jgi:RNA polymerase sigma-70 factor (ECF subfamily)